MEDNRKTLIHILYFSPCLLYLDIISMFWQEWVEEGLKFMRQSASPWKVISFYMRFWMAESLGLHIHIRDSFLANSLETLSWRREAREELRPVAGSCWRTVLRNPWPSRPPFQQIAIRQETSNSGCCERMAIRILCLFVSRLNNSFYQSNRLNS